MARERDALTWSVANERTIDLPLTEYDYNTFSLSFMFFKVAFLWWGTPPTPRLNITVVVSWWWKLIRIDKGAPLFAKEYMVRRWSWGIAPSGIVPTK